MVPEVLVNAFAELMPYMYYWYTYIEYTLFHLENVKDIAVYCHKILETY